MQPFFSCDFNGYFIIESSRHELRPKVFNLNQPKGLGTELAHHRVAPVVGFLFVTIGGNFLARINIEDSIYKDPRFIELAMKLGDLDKAIGMLVRAWSLAQKWYLTPSGKIPKQEWDNHGLETVVNVRLAKVENNYVSVSGSDCQFAWLKQRSNAGKSKRSTKAKSLKKTANDRQRPSTTEEPLTLTPTLSLSQSSISDNLQNASQASHAVEKNYGSLVWDSYCQVFEKRYGVIPKRNIKTNSQCKQLFERLGSEAVEVVKFYLSHNDGFYLKKQHPIGLCLSDAESLHTQWQRGQSVTSAQVRQAEKTITNQESLNQFFKQLEDKK